MICTKCTIEKEIIEFQQDKTKKRGFHSQCKKCLSDFKKANKKEYSPTLENKICSTCKVEKVPSDFDKSKRHPTGYFGICKECRKISSKDYYEKNSNKIIKRTSEYSKKNKEKIREQQRVYSKNRLATDIKHRLTRNLRNRLYYALKNKEWKKDTHFSEYIGCTREELVAHIEKQFKEGMSWNNYGEFHLDHIIPLSSANTEEELYALCHYTNLQPMWAEENIRKSNNVENNPLPPHNKEKR